MKEWNSPAKCFCQNCGKLLYGFKSDKGLIKFQCSWCKLTMVSADITRRHKRVDLYAPPD